MRWLLAVALVACSGKSRAAADAAPPDARPPDACDRAMANLKKIGAAVEGDAEDREFCLKFPPEIVRCLETVKTEAEADACVKSFGDRHGLPEPDGGDEWAD